MAVAESPWPADDAKPFDWWGLGALIGIAIAIGAAILLREPIVAARPNLAGLYRLISLDVNVRGLDFARVDLVRDVQNGAAGLVVEGDIRNATGRRVAVPSLKLALQGADGRELSSWTADVDRVELDAGESVPFRTRVASPPDAAAKLLVRFGDGSQ